ncbi:alpha/beta hydrolase [Bradyrhizobium hipponense]|uniref:Alpha/beta hydrolase n=1 Tax=Bradyrhizobium hipponense TaxID=2605638 RepID=A0A5S4YBI4_9BRAD|nr:alpha/beta hydrolase [Bradyrhizobium hipponense]TYO61054.1 alpha/beta hydrolase [Bradyrhizobium hipponense]
MTVRYDYLRVNGTRLLCAFAGEDCARTIIVVHGGRGSSEHGADFAAFRPLADSFRIVAYDQRGCGRSELAEPITFDQLVDDLEALRKLVSGDRPVAVAGFSFGGMVALTHILKYPQGVSHLVLIGTAASHHFKARALEGFDRRAALAPMATRQMAEKRFGIGMVDDIEFRLIQFAMGSLDDTRWTPDVALEAARTMPLNAEVHTRLYQGERYDLRSRLREIKVPSLIICGAEDWICPQEFSVVLAQGIPDSRLVIVPDCSHSVHQQRPDLVTDEIRRWTSRSGRCSQEDKISIVHKRLSS